jgi:hypothetical protein
MMGSPSLKTCDIKEMIWLPSVLAYRSALKTGAFCRADCIWENLYTVGLAAA